MNQKLSKTSDLQKKQRLEEAGEQKVLLRKKEIVRSETTLAILQPGKYLMLNQNSYARVDRDTSVLLVEDFGENFSGSNSYKVVLCDQKLLIARPSEIEIQ